MSILIDKKKCVGCRKCKDVCPGGLIAVDENNKAFVKYPRDCWGCTACLKECKQQAIGFFLGLDAGGRGSVMRMQQEKDILHWQIEKNSGEISRIDINTKDSNKY